MPLLVSGTLIVEVALGPTDSKLNILCPQRLLTWFQVLQFDNYIIKNSILNHW